MHKFLLFVWAGHRSNAFFKFYKFSQTNIQTSEVVHGVRKKYCLHTPVETFRIKQRTYFSDVSEKNLKINKLGAPNKRGAGGRSEIFSEKNT